MFGYIVKALQPGKPSEPNVCLLGFKKLEGGVGHKALFSEDQSCALVIEAKTKEGARIVAECVATILSSDKLKTWICFVNGGDEINTVV